MRFIQMGLSPKENEPMNAATVFQCFNEAGELVAAGPIRGNGGMLGYAAAHRPKEERDADALETLLSVQRYFLRNKRQSRLYEPAEGRVAVFPGYCATEDGESVAVPLVGTRFEVSRG